MSQIDRSHQHLHDVRFDRDKRYDVLVLAQNNGFRLADGAARALILNLKTNDWVTPIEEAIGDDFVEVYGTPAPSGHAVFTPKSFPEELEAFHEAAVYFGAPVELDYGSGVRAAFYIEFRGCLFTELLGSFKKNLKTMINIRTKTLTRPFESLPAHREGDDSWRA